MKSDFTIFKINTFILIVFYDNSGCNLSLHRSLFPVDSKLMKAKDRSAWCKLCMLLLLIIIIIINGCREIIICWNCKFWAHLLARCLLQRLLRFWLGVCSRKAEGSSDGTVSCVGLLGPQVMPCDCGYHSV